MNRNLESILVLEKILMKKDLPDGYMDEMLRYFTFSIYDFLKYFPERTMQFAFLTACDMIQTIAQKPSEPYFMKPFRQGIMVSGNGMPAKEGGNSYD